MISLIEGLPAADTILQRYAKENVLVLGPLSLDGARQVKAGDAKLFPETKLVMLVLFSRLLNITSEDYRILRTILAEANTLRKFVEKAQEQPFNSPKLSIFTDYLICTIDDKDISDIISNSQRVVMNLAIAEPYSTLLSLIYLCTFYRESLLKKFSAVFLITNILEDVLDILVWFRNIRLYVVSLSYVAHLRGIVDEYIVNIVQIPQDKPRIVRLCAGKVSEVIPSSRSVEVANVEMTDIVEKLSDVEKEVLQILSEMNFMSLNALRDAISQNLHVDKHEVDRAVLKLEKKGLVQIRILPDGRVMVYPTVLGLVKAKEKST